MKVSSKMHGILDYASVLFLWLSPILFGLPEITSYFTYVLGGVHLSLTVLTKFELGLFKVIPLKAHSIVEAIVAITLVAVAFYLGNIEGSISQIFYLTFAGVLAVLWFLTEYRVKSNE